MELDPRKRYCQNRVPKRKKEVSASLDPAEEERQFKLNRFVKDVNKFIENKENDVDHISKNKNKKKNKPVKKPFSNMKPVAKIGLFQNGVQTHFCTRAAAAATTREMTARLDESLAEIIGLANKNTKPSNHCCQIPHATGCENPLETEQILTKPCFGSATSNKDDNLNCTVTPLKCSSLSNREPFLDCTSKESLNELDRKLYLEFTSLITNSCVKSKSRQFKNQSYASELKKKLVGIYLQRKRENTQESSCASEPQKSSVATSPLAFSPIAESDLSKASGKNQLSTFTQINFVPNRTKSDREFIEEMIGPSSSCHNTSSPELHSFRPSPTYSQVYRPSPALPTCSQPFTSRPDVYCHPELSSNPNYMKSPLTNRHFSPYEYSSMRIFGNVDRRPFNQLNWFLPPVEDDSPEFRYFPRMMF